MKILHICMSQYSDGWTYQENLLAKYHRLLGFDVTIITSMYCYHNGDLIKDSKTKFVDCNGCQVIRLQKKIGIPNGKIPKYKNFYKTIESIKPDIIFSHGCQYADICKVKKYINLYQNVKLYVDNHADFSNSATTWISKNILHKVIWKHYAHVIEPVVKVFWGVLPARVDFLVNVYKLPKEKCKLLLMGGDDELIRSVESTEYLDKLRKSWNIQKNDFLVVTGGKIDKAKSETLLLMKAVKKINDPHVKLLIFGSVEETLKKEINGLTDGVMIQQAGWIKPENSYGFFGMADLVVFPGRHSVFWEQVAAQGIPMIVKEWRGTQHVNVCNNVIFLSDVTSDMIIKKITDLVYNKKAYQEIRKNAKRAQEYFSYMQIAKKSIEIIDSKNVL